MVNKIIRGKEGSLDIRTRGFILFVGLKTLGIPCYYELLDTNHQCPNFSTSILILDIKHEDSDEDMPLAKRKTDKKRKAQVHTDQLKLLIE